MAADLAITGLAEEDRRFNLSWHDWMNLENLILVSRAICVAAIARENSRGAHFRDDFPEAGDLETSTYTVARQRDGEMMVENRPVEFTRIRPGESLIEEDAA
jgi:fumarate reductase flavoprotein subunit